MPRLLDNEALQSICNAARELPVAERPVFLRVCCERFISTNASPRAIDSHASRTMMIDATATNAARVHGAKEKIFLQNKNLSMGAG
jgi:hypothetical protein